MHLLYPLHKERRASENYNQPTLTLTLNLNLNLNLTLLSIERISQLFLDCLFL